MRTLAFVLTLLVPLLGWCPPTQKSSWVTKVTRHFIQLEQKIGVKNINHEATYADVCWFYEASKLNPSWGSRETTTIRLLVSGYGESGLDPNCLNHNKNQSLDFGIMQINDVHLIREGDQKQSEWERFCKERGWNPRIGFIFNPYRNIIFAAHLNELFCKYHQETYQYLGRWDKELIYRELLQDIDDVSPQEKEELVLEVGVETSLVTVNKN